MLLLRNNCCQQYLGQVCDRRQTPSTSLNRMRFKVIGTILLSLAASYYIYRPLPSTISEPWKLMLLDASIRSTFKLSFLAHSLGLSSSFGFIKYTMSWTEVTEIEAGASLRVSEAELGGVKTLVFEPTLGSQPRRAVLYFHGGGWTLCSTKMESYYHQCRSMAEDLDAIIISVEYRLAPQARFPDQYDEALRVCKHVLSEEVLSRYSIDPQRVAVSGDSAGGNLAAAIAQQIAVDASIPVKFKLQALVYPALQALDFNTPSLIQNEDAPLLQRPLMARFWLEYLGGDPQLVPSLLANNHSALDQIPRTAAARAKLDWTRLLPADLQKNFKPVVPLQGEPEPLQKLPGLLDVRAAPLLAEMEVLRAVPPAYIMTCEHDVLRDDGLMYARRLEEAGVSVKLQHYQDGFHGCMSFAFGPFPFEVGVRGFRDYLSWLKNNL